MQVISVVQRIKRNLPDFYSRVEETDNITAKLNNQPWLFSFCIVSLGGIYPQRTIHAKVQPKAKHNANMKACQFSYAMEIHHTFTPSYTVLAVALPQRLSKLSF